MYIPAAFEQTDLAILHAFIEQHSFGVLVSQVDGQPFATHLPLLLDRADGASGTLVGHMARANPQWQQLAPQTALVVFSGPHAYISPTWYAAENTVPTWNYTAVHATGTVQLVENPLELRAIVDRSTAVYESAFAKPWTMEADERFVERMLAQIVGFRIVIARLEGKFKLNQNHSVERRERVIRALKAQPDENASAIAQLMQDTLPFRQ